MEWKVKHLNTMSNQLNEFGEKLITEVRDESIFTLESILSGKMKGALNVELHQTLIDAGINQSQIEIIIRFSYRAVDTALHNLLVMFEQSEYWQISNKRENIESLSEISDGLAGELYNEDGWIEKFSKYPPSIKW